MRTRSMAGFVLLGAAWGAAPTAGARDTIRVPADAPTIQAAINSAAASGDEIVVAPGTYNERIDFVGKAVHLRSVAGAEVTVIDAEGDGRVVTCANGEGPGTVLEGFAITGGSDPIGAGMLNLGTSPTVRDCVFAGNGPEEGGEGGAMCNSGASPTIIGCVFEENHAEVCGGMLNLLGGRPVVIACRFEHNEAELNGGGMYNFQCGPGVINCTFVGNDAGIGGGGMICVDSNAVITNCTITLNEAGLVGGGLLVAGGNVTMANCIVWANANGEISGDGAVVTYSDIGGGYEGDGNIDADPMFPDAPAEEARPLAGSPCIDAGNNLAVPDGVFTDLDSRDRFIDDPTSADTGVPGGQGGGQIVDMGAHESLANCPSDFDDDGFVTGDDLDAFLGAFEAGFPAADFDGDGRVAGDDFDGFVAAFAAGC